MRKIRNICLLIACCALLFVGCAPSNGAPVIPNPDPDDNAQGGGEISGIENIAGFDNLAEELATISISTDDGTDITGSSVHATQIYKPCKIDLTGGRNGENFSDAAANVRVRGNNTADYPKKSYRLKFDDKVNLLGLNNGAKCKNWVILACYKDVTFLRDAVVFELAKQTLVENGYYASDYAFAEVNVNGAYNGLYMVAEQQQVNKNRININEPDDGYYGNDIGWLVEFDGNAYMEEQWEWFTVNYKAGGYEITCEDGTKFYPGQMLHNGEIARYTIKNDIYEPKAGESIQTSQYTFIRNYTENVFKLIYDAIYKNVFWKFNADFTALERDFDCTDSRSAIEKAVDIDSMVDTFVIAEIACDNDVDWSSFFFTFDNSATGNKKLTFQAPWDFDSGFGMMRGLETYDKIFSANVSTNAMQALNPWTSVFFSADWFRVAVAERFAELEEAGAFDRLIELIDKVTETYKPYFDKNYEKWDNLGKIVDEVQGDTVTTFQTHADAAKFLREWITHRVEFLSGYFSDVSENR